MIFFKNIFKCFKAKRVVYTCMFGYSEKFSDRKISFNKDTDFILFTDDPDINSQNWNVVFIDSKTFGPVKTSKKIKILAHKYLRSYNESLYIDNTVAIKSCVDNIFSYLNKYNNPMLCFKHPERTCLYAEADIVANIAKYDRKDVIDNQMNIYANAGFPRNYGLIAGTVLLRRHNDPIIIKLMETWWHEVLNHSFRDQLSFNYAAWTNNFEPHYFDGKLTDNELINWPVIEGIRLPRSFNDDRYLKLNPDIMALGINPRKHYLLYGHSEGRPW